MSEDVGYFTDEVPDDQVKSFGYYAEMMPDTTYGMATEDYVRAIVMAGFEPLVSDGLGRETFHVYGRAQGGLLLTFDTFHKQRNCASVQFRTARPIWADPPTSVIEDTWKIDGKTTHVRLDARAHMLAALAFFEETTDFVPFWGNRGIDLDICSLTLEQDAAVALREGVSPRDMSARMREVSARRIEMLPKQWRDRWDLTGGRSSGDARKIA